MSGIVRGRGALLTAPVLALLAAIGCNNALEWTADDGSFDALMAAGHQAIRSSDYEAARQSFEAAVEQRPQNSEARFYLAKAAVLAADMDVFDLVQTLTDETGDGATEIFETETTLANGLYRTNATVLTSLRAIRSGEAYEGSFAEADVDLDLGVAYTLRGILRLRDTNGDGFIDALDLGDGFGLVTDDDGEYGLEGLDQVPPDDLNSMIDDMSGLLDEGGDVLNDALGDSGVDVDELNSLVDALGGDLSQFYVNTGLPGNPGEGDNDGDGLVDEECLNQQDDDGDGLVDEDARVAGCPTP
jgi:hypothetical protein